MKKLCPLWPHSRFGCEVECVEERCGLADETGKCLIKQFLELQVSKSLKEKEAAETYWATKKDGTRQPLIFPPTKDVLVDSRVSSDETPKFRPPRYESKESPADYYAREKFIDELLHDPHDRGYCGS